MAPSTGKGNDMTIEIFLIKSLNYIGIYGSPENFFLEGVGATCKISRNILTFINLLITEVKWEKYQFMAAY